MSQTPMGYKISPLLQEHICRLGSKLTFAEAASELSMILRIEINAKQVERICHCYGQELDNIDWQESYSDSVQLKFSYSKSAPVYCMADGSMLLTREEKWKEIKLGRIFSGKSHIEGISKGRGMIAESVYSAHFGKSDDFWERFSKEIPSGQELVFICDGAKWLWNYIDDCYPGAIQILDYYHCKEHVCELAKELFSPEETYAFINEVMGYLSTKQVEKGINKIRQLEIPAKAKQKARDKLVNYLNTNKKRIDYGSFSEKGLLIGSGAIEAAHRDVIQKRLKLSGQRWTIQGAQQIANLRVCEKSNNWHKVVSLIITNKNAA